MLSGEGPVQDALISRMRIRRVRRVWLLDAVSWAAWQVVRYSAPGLWFGTTARAAPHVSKSRAAKARFRENSAWATKQDLGAK